MKSWVSEYQHRGFEVLKRQAAIQRRMEEEALARYRESTVPRYFALWQVRHMWRKRPMDVQRDLDM